MQTKLVTVWDLVQHPNSPWKVVRVLGKHDMAITEPDEDNNFVTDRVDALSFEPPYICAVQLGRNPVSVLRDRLISKGYVDMVEYLCDSKHINDSDQLIYVPTHTITSFELEGAILDLTTFAITFKDGQQIRPNVSGRNSGSA